MSRNAITQSRSGCIILEGTNDAVVEDNVAFDTAGYCFATLGYYGKGNVFRRDLGSKTILATNWSLDLPEVFSAATFLSMGRGNNMEDNVAAGSKGVGFAIVPGSVEASGSLPWESFRNNIAHSNHVVRPFPCW